VDYSNFAPTFGFAWSPSARSGWLRRLVGDGGRTVLRAGYAMAYNRNGLGDFSGTFGANPGSSISANRDTTIGNLTGGTLGNLPLLFREKNRLGPPSFAATPVYPLTEVVTGDANIFDPDIKTPYSQSWTFGIQREITRDMAFEVRYVGTRNLRGWTDYDLNDVQQNILENGVLPEFKLAMSNLQAEHCSRSGQYVPLLRTEYRNGTAADHPRAFQRRRRAAQANDPARYTSTLFTNATFVNPLALNNPLPLTYAAALHSDAGRRTNALAAGLPANLFLTNPDLRGGAIFTGNGGYTRYDALQLELRRRPFEGAVGASQLQFRKGLLINSLCRLPFAACQYAQRGEPQDMWPSHSK
jgi:hypothetical protein